MKKIIYFGLVATILATISCQKEEEEKLTDCQRVKQELYSNIEEASFSVNNSATFIQNFGHQTFPDKKREELHAFAKLWEFTNKQSTQTICKLHFTYVKFDEDDCNPEYQHGVHLSLQIDQKPFETKEYLIGSSLEPNFAFYRGELLNEGEILRFSKNSAGTVTITKYIPESDIEGTYNINIDGIMVEGIFDYDLTKSY